jgi:hypothetical protein
MTKKDYVIASALHAGAAHPYRIKRKNYGDMTDWEKGAYDQWNTAVMSVADYLRRTNENFDHAHFLKVCGVK